MLDIQPTLEAGFPTAPAKSPFRAWVAGKKPNMSYYGRAANYDYKNKYMVEGQFRL